MAKDIKNRLATIDEKARTIEGLWEHHVAGGGEVTEDQAYDLLIYSDDVHIGSLFGNIFWNWLQIEYLWIAKEHRESGLGSQLMEMAEQEARERKLTGIYVWTESWQAPGFYLKQGYKEFTSFKDFPPGHTRYGFRKYLRETELN